MIIFFLAIQLATPGPSVTVTYSLVVLLVRCKTHARIANVIEASSLYIKLGAEAVHLFSSLVTSALVLNPDCTA